jgi:hypothetical protein
MKQPSLVIHSMVAVIHQMEPAILMMNAVKFMIVVFLEFVPAATWMVIVVLTNAVFSLLVCCFNENETLPNM